MLRAILNKSRKQYLTKGDSPYGIVAMTFVVSERELQMCYYIYYRTWEMYEPPLILPAVD